MKLASILGHSTTEVTLRYAHLEPGAFTERERILVDVDLVAPRGGVGQVARSRLGREVAGT